jgi:hypothetical protein
MRKARRYHISIFSMRNNIVDLFPIHLGVQDVAQKFQGKLTNSCVLT